MKRSYLVLILALLLVQPTLAQEEEMVAGLPLEVFGYLIVGGMALLIGVAVSWLFAEFENPTLSSIVTGLLAFTGLVHLFIGFSGEVLLILNGIGYLVLIGLQFLPQISFSKCYRALDAVIIIYTLITIIGYFVIHGDIETVGLVVKITEVALLIAVGIRFAQNKDMLRQGANAQ